MGHKRPVNLSLDADLVARAKALDVNLSQILEQQLVEIVRRAEETAWRRENAEAIDAYNQRVEQDGVFGEEWRTF